MRIKLIGSTGGIGSAIKEILREHEFEEIDWLIFAQGAIDEGSIIGTFDANTMSCMKLTQEYLPHLKKGVIYISSIAGIRGNTQFPIYSASKAALNSYAQTMARKHPQLQFYAICPGPTDTPMWRKLGLEGKAQHPDEVAKAVERVMNGEYKSGDIITVRNGEITV